MSYYNYDKIRSYNALMNIIMTNRGFGKTYGFKDMAIKNFLKKKQNYSSQIYKTNTLHINFKLRVKMLIVMVN